MGLILLDVEELERAVYIPCWVVLCDLDGDLWLQVRSFIRGTTE